MANTVTGSAVSFNTGQYTASATAGLLVASRRERTAIQITNLGSVAVYVGASGVTSGTGHLLPGVVGSSITVPSPDAFYVITASSTSIISYLEVTT